MKKLFLFIIALVALNVSLHAQDTPTYSYQVGDSVMVNPDSIHYMTGEKISSWVYTVKHAIEQIESAFHPDGVLLKGIKSWVHRNALLSDKQPAPVTTPQEVVVIEPTPAITDEVESQPVQADIVATTFYRPRCYHVRHYGGSYLCKPFYVPAGTLSDWSFC